MSDSTECEAKDPTTCRVHRQSIEKLTPEEARTLLEKEPEVSDPSGQRVRFGKRLMKHLEGKSMEEQSRRLVKLAYAIDAVQTTRPIIHPRGLTDRNVYIKPTSEKTSVMVFVDNAGEVHEVFDVFSKNIKDAMKSVKR